MLKQRTLKLYEVADASETTASSVPGNEEPSQPATAGVDERTQASGLFVTEEAVMVKDEPTAGWIIYTWNQNLIDGTTFRLPRMKVTANDGANMERNPRPVDIEVTRPIGETITDRDSQLDVAVRELLKQLDTQRSTSPR